MINKWFICFIAIYFFLENDVIGKNIFCEVPVAYAVGEIVTKMFPDKLSSEVTITPISGGYSGATLLLLTVDDRKYVVKIHQDTAEESHVAAELYALEHMEKLGIAPELCFVSDDKRRFVMDYKGNVLSIEQLHHTETIEYIAHMLRQVHSMPRSSFAQENNSKKMCFRVIDYVKRYQKTYATVAMNEVIESVIDRFEHLFNTVRLYGAKKTMIHGDMHSGNICGIQKDIVLIDWCFSRWEDPFFDIAMLSVTSGYTDEQERLFFNAYLERDMTEEELSRYGIIKQISFLHEGLWWCFCLLQVIDQGEYVKPVEQVHSYGYYSALFNQGVFSVQIAYEALISAFQAGGIIITGQNKHLF